MKKKIVILIIVVLVVAAGGFFWRQNQKDVKELNKNLPEGVRVEKNLLGFGNEYVVKNRIDGYEFKVPKEWKGLKEINYISQRTEKEYTGTSIELQGKEGFGRIMSIDQFRVEKLDINLEEWAESFFEDFDLVSDFNKEKLREFEIVKTKEQLGIIGYVYFFKKNSVIYTITGGSEEFIQDIISNGKW